MAPVILGYHGKETEALQLLDNGASIIVLHKDIADQLNIRQTQKPALLGINRKAIPVYVAKLAHQGLLGMNFLQGLDYRIDLKRQAISWKQ